MTQTLLEALAQDLQPATPDQPRYLMVLIDMAALSEAQRQEVWDTFADQLHPLLTDARYTELRPLGAMLAGPSVAGSAQANALASRAKHYGPDIVQGWITSALPPDALAQHLSHATFACAGQGDRYLLRYYDPHVLPVLHRHADPAWVNWLLSPIYAWWFSGATPAHPQWQRIPGGGSRAPSAAPDLVLTDALWQALVADPLPHRLLDTVEQEAPELFASPCRGVRLAQIEAQLDAARQAGLSRHEDLATYVLVALSHPAAHLAANHHWQAAVQRAAVEHIPLSQSLAALQQAAPRRPNA